MSKRNNAGSSKAVNTDRASLRKLLQDAARIVQAPICADLFKFRLSLRPILDRVMGTKHIKHITVVREKLFEMLISYYKKVPPNEHVQLMVTFSSAGEQEKGLDGSGLRRELYNTFFSACMTQRKMFVGKVRRSLPSNDMTMVQAGYFEALGRAIVASILNGDCGFPYLAPAVFYYLIDEDYTTFLLLEDVPDLDIKHLGNQLLKAKTDDEIIDIISSKEAAVIDHIGWPPGQDITLKTREALVQQLVRWSMIDKRKTSLDKFKQGLNHMGFLEATKRNRQLLPLLVYCNEYSITVDYIKKKIFPLLESLGATTDVQKQAKKFLVACINDMSDQETQWLFQFITGSIDPPIEDEAMEVEFNTFNESQKLPEASTCVLKLWIPQGNTNLNEFKKSFKCALENARHGFGQE